MKVNVRSIEALRIQRGYTMQQMAECMGYAGKSAYSNKVHRHRAFTLKDVIILSKMFNEQIEQLLEVEMDNDNR